MAEVAEPEGSMGDGLVLLSFCKGADVVEGQATHERVFTFHRALQADGWLATLHRQHTTTQPNEGLNGVRANVVLVFITQLYSSLLNTSQSACRIDFDSWLAKLGKDKVIPIVLDPQLLTPESWCDPLKVLDTGDIFDCTSPDKLQDCVVAVTALLVKHTSLSPDEAKRTLATLKELAETSIIRVKTQPSSHAGHLVPALESVVAGLSRSSVINEQLSKSLNDILSEIQVSLDASPSPLVAQQLDTLHIALAEQTRRLLKRNVLYSSLKGRLEDDSNVVKKKDDENRTPWPLSFPDEAVVMRAYLEWIILTHGKVDVHGAGAVDIEDVYVSLRGDSASSYERQQARQLLEHEVQQLASSAVEDDEVIQRVRLMLLANQPIMSSLEERNRTNGGEGMDVHDAFWQYSWLVILGDPGGGKTTVCRFLALKLAKSSLQALSQLRRGDYGSRLDNITCPILFRVSDFSRTFSKCPTLEQYFSTVSWMGVHPQKLGKPIEADVLQTFLTRRLEAQRAALLLDGLDEITDSALRASVVSTVDNFAAQWINPNRRPVTIGSTAEWSQANSRRGNRIVITSRIAGYHSSPLSNTNFKHFTVEPLSNDSKKQFCQSWMKAVYKAESKSLEDAATEAAQLVEEIEDPKRCGLQELSSSPLLLSTLCGMYHTNERKLPGKRVEIYQYFVHRFLAIWKEKPGEFYPQEIKLPYSSLRLDVNFGDRDVANSDQMVDILCTLARKIHQTSSTGLMEVDRVRQHFSEQLSRLFPSKPKADLELDVKEWLRIAREEIGILAARGEDLFGFVHLTFQEYLAARAIIAEGNPGEVIMDYMPDPRWKETIHMAIGHASVVWPEEKFNAFLEGLLADSSAEMGSGGNITVPRGCVLMAGALPEMVVLPDLSLLSRSLTILLRLCVNLTKYSGSMHDTLFKVCVQYIEGLGSTDRQFDCIFHVADSLDGSDPCYQPLAAIALKVKLENTKIVQVFLPRISTDCKNWGFPIQKLILSQPVSNLVIRDAAALLEDNSLLTNFTYSTELYDIFRGSVPVLRLLVAIYGGIYAPSSDPVCFNAMCMLGKSSVVTTSLLQWIDTLPEPKESSEADHIHVDKKMRSGTDGVVDDHITQLEEILAIQVEQTMGSKRYADTADCLVALLALSGWRRVAALVDRLPDAEVHALFRQKLEAAESTVTMLNFSVPEAISANLNQLNGAITSAPSSSVAILPFIVTPLSKLLTSMHHADQALLPFDEEQSAPHGNEELRIRVGLKLSDMEQGSSVYLDAFCFLSLLEELASYTDSGTISFRSAVFVDTMMHRWVPTTPDRQLHFLKILSYAFALYLPDLKPWELGNIPWGVCDTLRFDLVNAIMFALTLPSSMYPVQLALISVLQKMLQSLGDEIAPYSLWFQALHLFAIAKNTHRRAESLHATCNLDGMIEDTWQLCVSTSDHFVAAFGIYIIAVAESYLKQTTKVVDAAEMALQLPDTLERCFLLNLMSLHLHAHMDLMDRIVISCLADMKVWLESLETSRQGLILVRASTAIFCSTLKESHREQALSIIKQALDWLTSPPLHRPGLDQLDLVLALKSARKILHLRADWRSLLKTYLDRLQGEFLPLRGIVLEQWGMMIQDSISIQTPIHWPFFHLQESRPMERATFLLHAHIQDAMSSLCLLKGTPQWHLLLTDSGLNQFAYRGLLEIGRNQQLHCTVDAALVIDELLRSGNPEVVAAGAALLKVMNSPMRDAMPFVSRWVTKYSNPLPHQGASSMSPLKAAKMAAQAALRKLQDHTKMTERSDILLSAALLAVEGGEECILTGEGLRCIIEAVGNDNDRDRIRVELSTNVHHKMSKMTDDFFPAAKKIYQERKNRQTHREVVEMLLLSWFTDSVSLDDGELAVQWADQVLQDGLERKYVCQMFYWVRRIEPDIFLLLVEHLTHGGRQVMTELETAMLAKLFCSCQHDSSDITNCYAVWTADIVRKWLGVARSSEVHGSANGVEAAGRRSDRTTYEEGTQIDATWMSSSMDDFLRQEEGLYHARLEEKLPNLPQRPANLDPKVAALVLWGLGYRSSTIASYELYYDILHHALHHREEWDEHILSLTLLWSLKQTFGTKLTDLMGIVVQFTSNDEPPMIRKAALAAVADGICNLGGFKAAEAQEVIERFTPMDLLQGAIDCIGKLNLYHYESTTQKIDGLIADLVEAHPDQLLHEFIIIQIRLLRLALAKWADTSDTQFDRLTWSFESAYSIFDSNSSKTSHVGFSGVAERMPAAFNMALKNHQLETQMCDVLFKCSLSPSFPLRAFAVKTLSFITNVNHVDMGAVLKATCADVKAVRDAATESTSRLKQLAHHIPQLVELLNHGSANVVWNTTLTLRSIATSARCTSENRKAIVTALERAVTHHLIVSKQPLYSHEAYEGLLGVKIFEVLVQIATNIVVSPTSTKPTETQRPGPIVEFARFPRSPARTSSERLEESWRYLYQITERILYQFSREDRRIIENCGRRMHGVFRMRVYDFDNRDVDFRVFTYDDNSEAVHLVVGNTPPGQRILEMQCLYLLDCWRDIPLELLQLLDKLKEVAIRNEQIFANICVYALGSAQQTQNEEAHADDDVAIPGAVEDADSGMEDN